MKKYLVILLCLILCGCSTSTPQLNEQQSQCEHEWVEIDWKFIPIGESIYNIYCPKCKLEMEVTPKQWFRLQADMKYRNND